MPRLPSDRLTYAHFELTGRQDCANVISLDDFMEEWRRHPNLDAEALVTRVWKDWEEDGLEEEWVRQQDFEGLDPKRSYQAWRDGWMSCARRYVAKAIPDARKRFAEEENPAAGLTKKGERMYQHVKKSYAGDPRAKEIAARTVYARVAEGAPGLRRANPSPLTEEEMEGLIETAMAQTLWVTSYADWTDSLREENERAWKRLADRGLVARGGQNWESVAPAVPPSALRAAATLKRLFEKKNQTDLVDLLQRAVLADGKAYPPSERYVELFGHNLAMEALGHGVSWFDDHRPFTIEFPDFEAFSPDGRTLEWSPRS